MKSTLLVLSLFFLLTGQAYADVEKNNTDGNIGLNQKSIEENNKELINLLRKNSQQALITIELQRKIMQLEYSLSKINERLVNLESEVYKNTRY